MNYKMIIFQCPECESQHIQFDKDDNLFICQDCNTKFDRLEVDLIETDWLVPR